MSDVWRNVTRARCHCQSILIFYLCISLYKTYIYLLLLLTFLTGVFVFMRFEAIFDVLHLKIKIPTTSFPNSSLGMQLGEKLCFGSHRTCMRSEASPAFAFQSWSFGTRLWGCTHTKCSSNFHFKWTYIPIYLYTKHWRPLAAILNWFFR